MTKRIKKVGEKTKADKKRYGKGREWRYKITNRNRIAVRAETNETWGNQTGKENRKKLKEIVDRDEVIRIGEDDG